MPVLVSKDSGLAENLSEQQAQQAIHANTHEVPVYDPQGNFGSADYQDASALMKQGYSQPNAQQLAQITKYGKYSTTGEQAKTFAEGAASASTFGLSTLAERALGVNPKDIQNRSEVNPVAKGSGEAAGLVGSLATGVGEGALLGKAAEAIVPELAANFVGRVGTAAAKGAIENMVFQAGSEADKLFMGQDPNAVAETALTHVGMAGLLGAGLGVGFGAASEAWSAGPGKKLADILSTVKRHTEGVPAEIATNAGIELAPEMSAALSDNPKAQQMFQVLQESNSSSATKAQDMLKMFHEDAKGAALEALGKSPEDIDAVHTVSDYDSGKAMKDNLTEQMSNMVEPISKKYEEFASKFKSSPLTEDLKASMANNVASKIQELGLEKAPSDVQLKAMNKFLSVLPKQENVHDLKLLASNLSEEHPFGSDTYRVGKILKGIVTDAQDTALSSSMAEKAPEMLSDYKATQGQYRDVKNLIDDLNDRIHVGKSYGPESFIKNIREAAPEDIVRRLSPKNDVEMQNILESKFPELSQMVKANEINKILRASLTNRELNSKKLFGQLDKLSPEMRNYVLSAEQQKQLSALKDIMSRVPKNINPSGTASTLQKLTKYVPTSAAALGAMLFGHNPIAGAILAHAAQYMSREVPDAMRLAMLKFLGSSGPVSAEGLSAAAKLAAATIKGERTMTAGIKNILGSGGKVIPMPKASSMKVLEEQVSKVADQDPEQQQKLMTVGGHISHYMPDHSAALAMITSRNLSYLASLKPADKSVSPLEPAPTPSSAEKGIYDRALQIAQQPLIVLNSVKDGSVTAQDMRHLKTMYPSLYQQLGQKLTAEMTSSLSKGKELPYDTKMGISSFLGQPLDASMSPQSIISTQSAAMQQNDQRQPAQQRSRQSPKMEKLPQADATPQQARQMQRSQMK